MKKSALTVLILPALLVLPPVTRAAEPLPFGDVWSRIETAAPSIQAASREIDGLNVALDRAERIWHPSVTLDTRGYVTNDAGLNFFSLLGQRRADAADFAPPELNHPGSSFFHKASLIADLPLYEGGMRETVRDATVAGVSAAKISREGIRKMEYALAARDYAMALSAASEQDALTALDGRVDQLIRRYQLGSKSSPVGYAGSLGLKSLQARIHGLLERSRAARRSAIVALSERAGLDAAGWEPAPGDYRKMLTETLGAKSDAAAPSEQTEAMREQARAASRFGDAEKARFLPRAGLAVQGDMTTGSRATEASYLAAVYLQWSLYNPSNAGTREQAGFQAAALQLRADQQALSDRIAAARSREALAAIETNLKLISDSTALSDEQIRIAETLFQNGSINALQLSEVISRRADLVIARSEAENQWIGLYVQNFLSSGSKTEN